MQTLQEVVFGVRCRANVAQTRQSRPDSGLGFKVEVLETVLVLFARSVAVGGQGS